MTPEQHNAWPLPPMDEGIDSVDTPWKPDDVKRLELRNGDLVVVDEDDLWALAAYPWRRGKVKGALVLYEGFQNGERVRYFLHRMIMRAVDGQEVDHIDRDPLNNRRSNLRTCTRGENNLNRVHPRAKYPYRGVKPHKGRWKAVLTRDGKVYRSGYFYDPADAARAYDELARQHHGAFAVLNFPGVVGAPPHFDTALSLACLATAESIQRRYASQRRAHAEAIGRPYSEARHPVWPR